VQGTAESLPNPNLILTEQGGSQPTGRRGVTALQLHPWSQGSKHPVLPTHGQLGDGAPVKGQRFDRNVSINSSGSNSASFLPSLRSRLTILQCLQRSESTTGRQRFLGASWGVLSSPEPQMLGRRFPGSPLPSCRGGDGSSPPRSRVTMSVCNA